MSEILKHGSGTSKLGAIYDELVTFLCGFARYSENGGGAVRGVMLEAYDGGPHWIDRIKRPNVYVPNWSLVVAGNIQPRRLAAMAANLVDDGLFQRFLTIHTRPPSLGLDDDRPVDRGGQERVSRPARDTCPTCTGNHRQAVALLLRRGWPRRAAAVHAPR